MIMALIELLLYIFSPLILIATLSNRYGLSQAHAIHPSIAPFLATEKTSNLFYSIYYDYDDKAISQITCTGRTANKSSHFVESAAAVSSAAEQMRASVVGLNLNSFRYNKLL